MPMEFKIDWKIKNFPDLPERKGQLLSSPIFAIDTLHNSQWALHLYPYGDNDGNGKFTALYLVRKPDDDYSEDIILDCQLSFFVHSKPQSFFEIHDPRKIFEVPDPKKTELASWKTSDHTFQKGGRCGSQEFLEKGKISSCLENGTLTVRCVLNFYQKDIGTLTSGGCVAISLIGTENRTFLLVIENFQDMKPGDMKVVPIKSAWKDANSMTMTLSMTDEEILMVDISPLDRETIKCARCLFYSRKGASVDFLDGRSVWLNEIKNQENWSFPLDCKQEQLKELQINNSLQLQCEFQFYLGIEFEKVQYTYYKPVSDQKRDNDSCNIM